MIERVLPLVVFVLSWVLIILSVFRAQVDWIGLLIGLLVATSSGTFLLARSDVLRDPPDEER